MLHAHMSSRSRDCDGTYDKEHVMIMTAEEQTDQFGDYEFRNRVVASMVSFSGMGGTLTVQTEGNETADWYEQTEEGFRHVEAAFCTDESCDPTARFYQDHTAESMGY